LNNKNIRNYEIQTHYNVHGGSTARPMDLKPEKIYPLIGGYLTSPSTPDYLFYLTSPCIYTVATIRQHCAVKHCAHEAILSTQCTDRFLPYRHSCDVLISSSTDTLSVRYCGVRRGMRTVARSFGRSFFRKTGSLFTHLMTASNTFNRIKQ
jgi:hypothetical protein